MTGQISRIRAKLARAAATPELLESFGARAHAYRLNPPLSEVDVAAFETEHGVTLPAEYRRFVLELGDGGAGPSYGLVPLRESFDWDSSPDGFLAAPSHFASGVEYTPDAWDEDFDEPRRGSLAIVHHGCAYYTQLVVSGPGRGRLVNISHDGGAVPVVAEDPDFLSWYERWLDELLAGYAVTWFGNKLPGDEVVLAEVLAHDPSPDRRTRAARSLACLPAIGTAGAEAFAAAVADPVPAVRTAVLNAVGSTEVVACEHLVRAALTDPVAEVRGAAMWALRRLAPADLAGHARSLLGDDEPDVVRQAVYALKDLAALTVGDVEPLTGHANADIRGTAVWAAEEATGDVVDLLARAVVDEDRYVRVYAVQSAYKRDERALLGLFQDRLGQEADPTVITNLTRTVEQWTS